MTQIHTQHHAAPVRRSVEHILSRITEVVLLAGTVRPTPLHKPLGRSGLDLPVDESRSILNHWQDHILGANKAEGQLAESSIKWLRFSQRPLIVC